MLALDKPELLERRQRASRSALIPDKHAGTLTVADNGVGMDGRGAHRQSRHHRAVGHARLPRAGRASKAATGKALIGQFGVGFYSAFMVAVGGRRGLPSRGSDEAWRWRSDGKGAFTIEPAPLDQAPARGTRVVLKLMDDAKTYAEQATIERIVAETIGACSGADRHKTRRCGERRSPTAARCGGKPKSAIKDEEYAEFYHLVGGHFDDPALTIHYRAEGRNEYSVLLFIRRTRSPPWQRCCKRR